MTDSCVDVWWSNLRLTFLQNSDDSDSDKKPVSKSGLGSSASSGGMSRGRSGLLTDLPSASDKFAAAKKESSSTSDFDANQYFNNDDDDEEEGEGAVDRLQEIERRMAEMESQDANLRHLQKNIQDGNDASEVISESGSVASEDIDVLEFSAGGNRSESDDDDGF